jgi:hypothetical protein
MQPPINTLNADAMLKMIVEIVQSGIEEEIIGNHRKTIVRADNAKQSFGRGVRRPYLAPLAMAMFWFLIDDEEVYTAAPAARFYYPLGVSPVTLKVFVCGVIGEASYWVAVLPKCVCNNVSRFFVGSMCFCRYAQHPVKDIMDQGVETFWPASE